MSCNKSSEFSLLSRFSCPYRILVARVIFLNEESFRSSRKAASSLYVNHVERRPLESLMRRKKDTVNALCSISLFYLRTGDFTFRIYVDYSGKRH